jgi:hypothetical protein
MNGFEWRWVENENIALGPFHHLVYVDRWVKPEVYPSFLPTA